MRRDLARPLTVATLLRRASAEVAELLAAGRDAEAAAVLSRLRAEAQRAIIGNLTATRARPIHPRRRPSVARATSKATPR